MFDLATAKIRLGIAVVDTTKDTLIGSVLLAAKSIAENYCDRMFDLATQTEVFNHHNGPSFSLRRYPLTAITAVTTSGGSGIAADRYHRNDDAGLLIMHDQLWQSDVVTVQYTGGYTNLPDDLLIALWRIFDAIWADMPGGGAGAGAAAGSQAINSITIPDVGTIRYESSGAAGSSGAGAANGLIDNVTAALLSFYRRENC